jgi:RNA polymerase sigma factor (sigma-70 family)
LTSKDLKKIYDEYHLMVFNLALNYLQNTEEAEEITQDVFVKVFQSYDRFKHQSSIKTWIYRIALNQCNDLLKYKQRQKRFSVLERIFDDNGTIKHEQPDWNHPGIQIENSEQFHILLSTIDKLPEIQKSAFLLSHIEGLGNKEIAEIVEKSVGAVESILQRTKETLRKELLIYYEQWKRNE